MSYYLIQQLNAIENVHVRPHTQVIEAHGDDHLTQLTLRDTESGATEQVPADFLFVFIGAEPRTDWLDGVVARDGRGFLLTGPDLALDGAAPRGWNWTGRRSTWSRASPASSSPATSGPNRRSASPPRWARARWPSCSSTAIWKESTREHS